MESNTKAPPTSEKEQPEAKIISIGHLLSYMMRLKDSRKARGLGYRMEIILVLVILAKLCGQNKVYGIADWVQQRSAYLSEALRLKRKRMPHHST
jgi:hypothetical protein